MSGNLVVPVLSLMNDFFTLMDTAKGDSSREKFNFDFLMKLISRAQVSEGFVSVATIFI